MSDALTDAIERLLGPGPDVFDKPSCETMLLLVRGAVERLAWGTMNYRCEQCGFEWEIWLSLGVEGPADLREVGLYVASPFTVRCPAWPKMQACGGTMSHVRFSDDVRFGFNGDRSNTPKLIPDDAPRFVLPYSVSSGGEGARLEMPTDALVRARRALNE